MKYEIAMAALAGVASAREIPFGSMMMKREVPQEHSHEAIVRAAQTSLQLNNPLKIQDSVFALLGNKAAAEGAPNVQNLDCLQQIVADQAFTNAKAAGDLDGQVNAILFRALERNTGSVGLASVLCNETATNPEIAAITQHQDPASPEASGNKNIELEVAKQIASIGGDAQLALDSGTFAPGKIGDPTAKGNTCDDANDAVGCIKSQNLLTPAATAADIKAAVANVASTGNGGAASKGAAASATAGVAASAGTAAASAGASDNAVSGAATASGTNVQTFTGTLGGAAPPVISSASERPFDVNGATFLNIGAALSRSCDVQFNACANLANSGQLSGSSVSDCTAQKTACDAAKPARMRRAAEFGSCGSPAIEFAAGLDGRKEESFQAVNQADFNHGSALNIKVIAQFNCDQLTNKCKADQAVVAKCDAAATAASALKGQAAADAFNNALGVSA